MPHSDIRTTERCPTCGAPPPVRYPAHLAEYAATLPPLTEIQSQQCKKTRPGQNRECGTIYGIRAGSIARQQLRRSA